MKRWHFDVVIGLASTVFIFTAQCAHCGESSVSPDKVRLANEADREFIPDIYRLTSSPLTQSVLSQTNGNKVRRRRKVGSSGDVSYEGGTTLGLSSLKPVKVRKSGSEEVLKKLNETELAQWNAIKKIREEKAAIRQHQIDLVSQVLNFIAVVALVAGAVLLRKAFNMKDQPPIQRQKRKQLTSKDQINEKLGKPNQTLVDPNVQQEKNRDFVSKSTLIVSTIENTLIEQANKSPKRLIVFAIVFIFSLLQPGRARRLLAALLHRLR